MAEEVIPCSRTLESAGRDVTRCFSGSRSCLLPADGHTRMVADWPVQRRRSDRRRVEGLILAFDAGRRVFGCRVRSGNFKPALQDSTSAAHLRSSWTAVDSISPADHLAAVGLSWVAQRTIAFRLGPTSMCSGIGSRARIWLERATSRATTTPSTISPASSPVARSPFTPDSSAAVLVPDNTIRAA